MTTERTLSIIKPDATRRNLTGAINALQEKAGLRIVAQKRLRLSRQQAEDFYAVHKERPFYQDLVAFMTSGNEVPNGAEALIVINDAKMGELGEFKRCFLIFDGRSDGALELARQRWRELKASGHELTYWQQTDQGRWEKGTGL